MRVFFIVILTTILTNLAFRYFPSSDKDSADKAEVLIHVPKEEGSINNDKTEISLNAGEINSLEPKDLDELTPSAAVPQVKSEGFETGLKPQQNSEKLVPSEINSIQVSINKSKSAISEIVNNEIVNNEKSKQIKPVAENVQAKAAEKKVAKIEIESEKINNHKKEDSQYSYLAEPQLKPINAVLQPVSFLKSPVGGKITFKPQSPSQYNFAYGSSKPTLSQYRDMYTSPQQDISRGTIQSIERKQYVSRVAGSIRNLKKRTFVSSIGNAAAEVNEKILNERKALMYVFKRYETGQKLTYSETQWLNKLAVKYRVSNFNVSIKAKRDELLTKVNIVPESLAVAQAALESGWGRSKIAKFGHNYFGQKCFEKGCGVNSARGSASGKYAVFKTPKEAVEGYIHNLNTNGRYQKFRIARQHMGAQPSGKQLVHYLDGYSELGEVYENKVKSLINYNKLEQ